MGPLRVLLDTHAPIWWLFDDPKLTETARQVIGDSDNRIVVSSASAWEIATKHRRGRLSEAGDLPERFEHYVEQARFTALPITVAHALAAGRLLGPHKDPFDRVLIAQSLLESMPVVTADPVFADYGAAVVW